MLQGVSVFQQLPAGSNLFLDGDEPRGVFFVRGGKLEMSVANRVGRTRQVCCAGPGEVLGLSSSITGKPLDCRADVTEDATLQFVPRTEFLEFIRTDSETHLEIVKILSMDVGRCYEVLKQIDAANRGEPLRAVPPRP
ncbi:MAG: Crp/Fnr family transcriptional regulator [Thermoanaerobaculia bacterium]